MSDSKPQFKNLPPLSEWPDWAQWATFDDDGVWTLHKHKPKLFNSKRFGWYWKWESPHWDLDAREPEETRHLWRESLTKRPTQ